jgi:hypothetical protein
MRKSTLILVVFIVVATACGEYRNEKATQDETGEVWKGDYLGQEFPGAKAVMFAPGVMSTGLHDDGGPAFSPDGKEVFFRIYGEPVSIIAWMKQGEDGIWSDPEIAPFSGHYMDGNAVFSSDGDRIYFSSPRPASGTGEPEDSDIWYCSRSGDGWSEPENLGEPVNSPRQESIAFITDDNTLYFLRIEAYDGVPSSYYGMCSRMIDGVFQEPEKLGEEVNSGEFLTILVTGARDESYLIVSSRGREDSLGSEDLYVSFRREDGSFGPLVNLGPDVNSTSSDWLSSISPDGRFLFFTSFRNSNGDYCEANWTFSQWWDHNTSAGNGRGGDRYWVSTEVIEKLRLGQ